MNIIFRIALAIYAFCLTVISAIAILFTLRPYKFLIIADYIYTTLQKNSYLFITLAIEIVFLALSVTFLSSGIRSSKDKRAVSKFTDIGEIKISLDSIEGVALSAVKRINSVKDTKAYISKDRDCVSILIKVTVSPDASIPSISEEIQKKVRKSVEDCCGIKVSQVKVLIEDVYSSYKFKVE